MLFAALELWRRDPARALRHAEDGLALAEAGAGTSGRSPQRWHGTRAWADLVAAGGPAPALAGRPAAPALPSCPSARRRPSRRSAPWSTPSPLMCAAETARAEHRRVPEVWERAAGMWERHQQPYPAAYARLRHAEALLERSPRSGAAAACCARRNEPPGSWERSRSWTTSSTSRGGAGCRSPSPGRPRPWSPGPRTPLDDLTGRELEVLVELAKGFTNREIGRRLYISEKTVGVHLTRIFPQDRRAQPRAGQRRAPAVTSGASGDW